MNTKPISNSFDMAGFAAKDEYFSSISAKISSWLVSVVDSVLDYLDRQHERTLLARMDTRELKDIGLTPSDIGRVADQPTRPPGLNP